MVSNHNKQQALKLYIDMVQQCRKELNPDMTISQLLVLLLVARDGRLDQKDIYTPSSGWHLTQSSTSRAMSALSKVNRQRKPGLNVVNQYEDPMERRRKLAELTGQGEQFIDKLTAWTTRRIQRICGDAS